MTKKEDIEIMAPVGTWESLTAAVQAGANAVYFGIDKLNMRSQSTVNFTLDDLTRIVQICEEHQMKSYLTLNTVMYDQDLHLLHELIDAAKKNKITAVIASDIAAIQYAQSIDVEVHISTQVNVSNIDAVKFYAHFADVVVLARELSLDQIAQIASQIRDQNICGPSGKQVRIELFIHGALCMAISGKCYLSLHQNNKSANRGSCLQMCRRSYIVSDKETNQELEIDNQYIMSPKDLCTIGFLDKILEAGVTVLKIEGRARPPEYVYRVVSCYKAGLEACLNGTFNQELIDNLTQKLATVFNRGFWGGYYMGKTMGEWSSSYGSKSTKKKLYIGKSMNYFSNVKVAEFLIETGDIKLGDEILIIGPTTGVVEMIVGEIRVNLKPVNESIKGERFSIEVPQQIRRSDKMYKLIDVG